LIDFNSPQFLNSLLPQQGSNISQSELVYKTNHYSHSCLSSLLTLSNYFGLPSLYTSIFDTISINFIIDLIRYSSELKLNNWDFIKYGLIKRIQKPNPYEIPTLISYYSSIIDVNFLKELFSIHTSSPSTDSDEIILLLQNKIDFIQQIKEVVLAEVAISNKNLQNELDSLREEFKLFKQLVLGSMEEKK
jgi:hypothetical protein